MKSELRNRTGSYNGTDSSNLKNAFDSIIRDATELLCTDVTVTDTLTDEVELVNQNLQVVVKDETGKVITKLKDASGNEAAVSKIITVSTAKDSDGKTQIIMRFEPSYKLESGYTYYVTAKIRPTTKAYLEYQNGSYTGTGDKNTDEYLGTGKKPGNDTRNNGTSSEQNGFYSNVSANVTYKYNNKTYTKDQTRETIQVINTDRSEAELKNLQSGQYYLEEVKAPEACMLLADKIYFKHRGLPSASLFTDLDQLEEGDHFLIHVLNETLCYEVDKISVVKPEETSSLAVEEGKDLVTLLTCTPYGVNTERLLVRGHRVPYVEQEVADEKTPLSGISLHTNYLLWVIIGLVITTIFILMLYLKEKKLQKKKNETS